MKNSNDISISVIYDHREVLNPLFQVLSEQGISYRKLNSYELSFVLPPDGFKYSVVYNDLTAPPYQFRTAGALNLAIEFLRYLEAFEPTVHLINGSSTSELLLNKAKQIALFTQHGFPLPKTIVTTLRSISTAVQALRFPIVIKEVANHAESFFMKINDPEDLKECIANNFHTCEGNLPVLVQEWIDFKDDVVFRLDLIDGEVARATEFRVMHHTDYVHPFLLYPKDFAVTPFISKVVREFSLTASLELASIEYGVDRRTNDLVFLGIHPHTSGNQSDINSDYSLAQRSVNYIESRLQHSLQLSHCI